MARRSGRRMFRTSPYAQEGAEGCIVRGRGGTVDGPFGRFGAGARPQGVPVQAINEAAGAVAAALEPRPRLGVPWRSAGLESSRAGPPEGPALGARSEVGDYGRTWM